MTNKIYCKRTSLYELKDFARRFMPKFSIAIIILIGSAFTISGQTNIKKILFSQLSHTTKVEQGKTQSLLEYISASDNAPVAVKLAAADTFGKTPVWLTVNSQNLNGINYTSGSEITFDFDATNLSIGAYSATVTASATGYQSATLKIALNVTSGQSGSLADFKVNFQDSVTITPSGWLRDFGQPFGPRSSASLGKGYAYGWVNTSDKTSVDFRKNSRRRNSPPDILLATFMLMHPINNSNNTGTPAEGSWEAQVVNGNYKVTVSVGDAENLNSINSINVEGINVIQHFVSTATAGFKSATAVVSVSDGFLTVDSKGGTNTKINWIIIKPYTGKNPSVESVAPDNGSKNVNVNTSISTSVLKLPNSGINNATITAANVYLAEDSTGVRVPANVNGTGGNDAITLVPSSPLKPGTAYRFTITSAVKDLTDSSFVPFSSTFTTDTKPSVNLTNIKFDKVALPNTAGQHSSLTIGPDGKLYALTIDGIIKRFVINADGTLGSPELIYTLQGEYGARTPVLAVGFTFDPSSTAANLIAWVTHDTFTFLNAPDWDGKLTRLSGPNLEKAEDVLINLPRSKKDHVTNSIAFGPDKALYFTQASTSAMGRADKTWGYRNEHLLSATVLRLDVSKLGPLPLDVKTAEGGGIYNPYDPNAALTIYASGVRNAYDLVWHSNGSLYVPTNSSAAGGNTPASVNGTLRPDGTVYSGPVVPALTDIQQTPTDFLYRVVKGGYYGHPNPLRGQFVMNGGNTSSATDPSQLKDYPLGTAPDPNYRGYSYDFDVHASPDGAIEYKSNTFKGALKGKLMVVRYSQHKDIITLTPGGPNKDIVSAIEGYEIQGFSGFDDPLDLTEDTTKGNIYVSEYGGDGRIVLLRPRLIADTASTAVAGNHFPPAPVSPDSSGISISHNVSTVMPVGLTHTIPQCDDTSQAMSPDVPVVLTDSNDEKIKVYPNPAHNQFHVFIQNSKEESIDMQMVDASGKKFELGTHALRPVETDIEVNLAPLSVRAGVYFLKVITNTKTELIKLIILP